MSMRYQVDQALLALLTSKLRQYAVVGLEDGAERPRRINPEGLIILRDGDPGEPEVDLSPPTYHYEQRNSVEIAAYTSSEKLRLVLDRMGRDIGAAIESDRLLGDLVSYMHVTAMEMADLTSNAAVGTQTQKGATFDIITIYSTEHPL
jgi:hypothetical protein